MHLTKRNQSDTRKSEDFNGLRGGASNGMEYKVAVVVGENDKN